MNSKWPWIFLMLLAILVSVERVTVRIDETCEQSTAGADTNDRKN